VIITSKRLLSYYMHLKQYLLFSASIYLLSTFDLLVFMLYIHRTGTVHSNYNICTYCINMYCCILHTYIIVSHSNSTYNNTNIAVLISTLKVFSQCNTLADIHPIYIHIMYVLYKYYIVIHMYFIHHVHII
jgi:hypothetical protein